MNKESLDEYFRGEIKRVETVLDRLLPRPNQHLAKIHEAMRYSVLNGGKRIRPILCLATSEMLGGREEDALIPASAIELIHCYSLVHDDLPCLDNDDLRRGQPTCHKKYGEAIALLTGDALLTLAFQVIGGFKDSKKAQRLTREISEAAGTFGMVGGQVMDISINPNELDLPTLDSIHIKKTGQLIKTSCLSGAISAGANTSDEERILKFGEYLGFAFQIVDDILDGDGYLRLMGIQEAREKAQEVTEKAKEQLKGFKHNVRLLQIADFVLSRAVEGK